MTSAVTLWTTSGGVLPATNTPTQLKASKPAKPCSVKVGTSGVQGERTGAETAIARTLPPETWALSVA